MSKQFFYKILLQFTQKASNPSKDFLGWIYTSDSILLTLALTHNLTVGELASDCEKKRSIFVANFKCSQLFNDKPSWKSDYIFGMSLKSCVFWDYVEVSDRKRENWHLVTYSELIDTTIVDSTPQMTDSMQTMYTSYVVY